MSLTTVALELVAVVTLMLVTAALALVGPRRLVAAAGTIRWRLEYAIVPVSVLAIVLVIRWSLVDLLIRLERRVVGTNLTPVLFDIDYNWLPAPPVSLLQSVQSPELTVVFAFTYIYGYAFLLAFPLLAYAVLDRMDHFSTLIRAYTANYAIGLVLYVLFLAYGPRNVDPVRFEGLLYDALPETHFLTAQVNQSTNVFPSLHTSLAVTVCLLAWFSRDRVPFWFPISTVLAVGVLLSTMYLGIHWFADVVAGIALAAVSVHLARKDALTELYAAARRSLRDRMRS